MWLCYSFDTSVLVLAFRFGSLEDCPEVVGTGKHYNKDMYVLRIISKLMINDQPLHIKLF